MPVEAYNSLLICPLSGEPLKAEAGRLTSSRNKYPNIDGLPWLYRDPEGALLQWKKKASDVYEFSRQKLDAIEYALTVPDLLATTRQRLRQTKAGHERNLECLSELLKPINQPASSDDQGLTLERVPRQQSAMAYQGSLFRDWVWGKEQVATYAGYLIPGLKGRKRLAFLGAGACGLPVAIHNAIKPEFSLAMDINPFLLLPAAKLTRGETVQLVEFPTIPSDSQYNHLEHTLKLEGPLAPGFELLFTNAQNLPVKDGALDGVVTSWFIDIISRDLREMARLINCVLETGGVWSNIGPLGFERNDLTQVYRPDEVKEILAESGFKIDEWAPRTVPYLKSPYDAIGREDLVWTFTATKVKPAKRPPTYDYWPTWLLQTGLPVPLTEDIRAYRVRAAIYSFVLEQVDGKKSIKDIAKVLAAEYGLNLPEAEQSVHAFFANYFEGVIFREF